MGDAAFGIGLVAFLICYPLALLAAVWGLAAIERRVVMPTERAAELERLLAAEDPETIETAVAQMLSGDADRPGRRVRTSRALARLLQRRG